jgi:TonB-linked SusC/RagA family outer membrane protein
MKLTTFFLLITFITVNASVYSQVTKLDLKVQRVTVKEVLSRIEDQSQFFFMYNDRKIDVERKVDLDIKQSKIEDLLKTIFDGTNTKFIIKDRQIVLYKENDEEFRAPNNESAVQQQKSVSGKVTDSSGGSLPGVSVVVKGTTTGVITDMDGKYSLAKVPENAILQFSFVGMKGQEVAVGNNKEINITLIEQAIGINEVVVVGYGSVKKSDITGSISSIKATDLVQMPTQRVDQTLQGRTPGVYILNTDGSPGGKTIIRIRGLNSINGGNEPLIVIDGLQGGNIDNINPNDISNIEILKDASATAIYGSRGANGVVLITTKLGKKGKPTIDFNSSYSFQNISRKLPTMSAADFAKTINNLRMKQTANGSQPVPQFTDEQIRYWEKNGGTDWQDKIFQTGTIKSTNIAVSGATDKLSYMVSSNYMDNSGILLNSGYNRFTLRSNLMAEITKRIDFGLNYSFIKENRKLPYNQNSASILSDPISNATRWAPTEPVYDEFENYSVHNSAYGPAGTWNPLASVKEPIIDNPSYQNNANTFLQFELADGLSLKILGGAIITNETKRDYYNLKTYSGLQNDGVGHVIEYSEEQYQNSNILTYDKILGKIHHITFTGVAEQIYESGMGSTLEGKGFVVDQLGYDNLGGAKSIIATSSHFERALISFMGRVNYVLADKYLATLTYRADGSSVFGNDNKWGYFPSGSIAWRVSQEEFLKNSSVINDLKLRMSYGITGNQGIQPYQSLARLSSGFDFYYPYNGGTSADLGFGISGLSNPNLKWETTSQANIGIDISLFKGRLTSTLDIYRKTTDNLLMARQLPGYLGVESILDNIGSIENKGLEILVGGDPIVGKLSWNTSVNFTLNRNKILDLGSDQRIGFSPTNGGYGVGDDFMFLEVGQPFGLMNGWKYLGVWKTEEDAEARKYGQLPGDSHFLDLNNDGQIDNDDRVTIGNGYPKFTWGWTNKLTYNCFELSVLVIGSHGNDLFNQQRIRRENQGEGVSPALLNAWTPDNQNTEVPGVIDGKYREDQHLVNKLFFGNDKNQIISRWVEDASFIKLKSLSFSYKFGQDKLKEVGIQNLRLFATASNLLTLTKYTGYDPEVAAFSTNDATIGVDLAAYPTSRTFTFGLDITF